MPHIFTESKNGAIAAYGMTDSQQPLQMVDELVVSEELLRDKESSSSLVYSVVDEDESYSATSRKSNHIKPGEFGVGNFLVSDGFGPCQLVVASLKDGNYAVYHAFSCEAASPAFQAFLDAIKNKIETLTLFQRTYENVDNAAFPQMNHISERRKDQELQKAAILHLELQDGLHDRGINLEVRNVKLSAYAAVVADASQHKVFVSYTINRVNETEIQRHRHENKASAALPIDKEQSLEQSKLTAALFVKPKFAGDLKGWRFELFKKEQAAKSRLGFLNKSVDTVQRGKSAANEETSLKNNPKA